MYVSYSGDLPAERDAALSALKALSASKDKGEQALASINLGGLAFHVRDKGAGKFKFVLDHPAFNLRVSSSTATRLPLASAQVRSAQLTQVGARESLVALGQVVADLQGANHLHYAISRVDLCVDFLADWDLLGWTEEAWLTHAAKTARYSYLRRGTGWTVGAGGDISCRLYDKELEIRTVSVHRSDVHRVWLDAGWNGLDTVYRVEFQLMREFLKQINITTLGDLEPMLGNVWRFLMTEWLRLVVPVGSDSKRSRWPTHPVWESIGDTEWPGSVTAPVARLRATHQPSEEHALMRLRGVLTSFMAVRGIAEGDEALDQMYVAMKTRLAARADRAGVPAESLLFDEAAAKATRVGKPFASVVSDAEARITQAALAARRKVTQKRTGQHGAR